MACGGGSSNNTSTTGSITGTAATGAAIAGKTVTAVDANGVQTTTTTGTDGKFTINVNTSAKPFMLKVTTSSGDTLFSLAENGGEVANITPMTNLAMQEMNSNSGNFLPLDNLFSAFKDHHAQVVTAQKIADAKGKVNATFQALMTANGVDTKTDFFKTAFNADSTKIDKVLDGLSITIDPSIKNGSIAASGITITFNGSTTAFNPNIAFSNFIPSGSGSGGSSGSLPSSVSGNIVVMTFDFLSTGKTGPVTLNTDVGFTFSSSGALFINTDNSGLDEITINSFTKVGSEYVWEDSANNFKYSLSLKTDSSINEINVNLISDGTFIGQFGTVVSNSGSSSSGGGSVSESITLTVDDSTKTFDSDIHLGLEHSGTIIAVSANASGGGSIVFRVPNQLGAFTCDVNITGSGTYTMQNGSSACNGNISSLSPLTATFSGTIFNLISLKNTEVTNGSLSVTNTTK